MYESFASIGNDNVPANDTAVVVEKSSSENNATCGTDFETTLSSESYLDSSDTGVRTQGQYAAKSVTVLDGSIYQKVVCADLPIAQIVKSSWIL